MIAAQNFCQYKTYSIIKLKQYDEVETLLAASSRYYINEILNISHIMSFFIIVKRLLTLFLCPIFNTLC